MLNTKKLLTKVLEWLSDPLAVQTTSASKSCAANTGTAVEITVTKSGYYPLAVVGYQISGSASGNADVRQLRMSSQENGSGTAYIYVWNNSGSAYTWTVTAHVLWVKLR